MKAVIIYFTGTGNTKFLASLIKAQLENQNHFIVDLFSIDSSSTLIDLKPYDYIIFSYPIYAFNAPIIFDKYVKKLYLPKNKTYIIAKQSGEPLSLNDSSSYYLIKRIKKSKNVLFNEYHFLLPYNIHFRYEDDFIKELLRYDNKLLDIMSYEIKNNISRKVKYNPLYALNTFVFKIQRLGGPVNSYFYKVDYSKCIHCNRCLNNCPTKSIKLVNEKYKFKNSCIMCMRCSFNCPTNAIHIGFLESWKVNGAYNYEKIISDDSLKGEFLKHHKSLFYNFFPKKIEKINKLHKEYFGK